MYITSKSNKIYKDTLKLLQKKYRDKNNLYLVEGTKILEDYKDEMQIEYIISTKEIESKYKVYIFDEALFNTISTQKNSQGIIVVAKKKKVNLENINGDVVILDDVQDPGNLGTIIRTMSAFGYNNLIITNNSCDEYSYKTLRATMGTFNNVNIYRLDKNKIIDFIKSKCYNVLITDLSDKSVSLKEMKYKKNNAYIFGNEGNGVSKEFKEISNQSVIIPISKNTESLNLSISVGIFLFYIKENYE